MRAVLCFLLFSVYLEVSILVWGGGGGGSMEGVSVVSIEEGEGRKVKE